MSQQAGGSGSSGGDEALMIAIVGAGGLGVICWLGAQAASLLNTGSTMAASPAEGFKAMFHLPGTAGEPKNAWSPEAAETLPGPILYWSVSGLLVLMILVLAVGLYLKIAGGNAGTDREDRLGVAPHARLARRRDLKPLIVKKPVEGRFILGRVGRKLVATEDRTAQSKKVQRNRETTRVGDRSAVIVVGPSRCGKTANVTAGVLDWDGPAVLSSVKDDLFNATIERRRQLGKVFVFDPFGELPDELGKDIDRVGWSPLQASTSISGAQQAAATLLDAGPSEGVTNANFWSTKGQQLLWPMLFAAAVNQKTMGDVVRWLTLQDGEKKDNSQVAQLLSTTVREGRGALSVEAHQALAAFAGFWLLEPRTRSDIFSTAQTVITAWEDPYVAASSATRVVTPSGPISRPSMNMAMLLEGNNTLYLVQPLRSAERFSVLFGGLLGDLLRDQSYEISKRLGAPIPATLAVIDEAGNTPLRWLPEVASTCSGVGIQLVTVWQSLAQMRAIYQAQTDSLLTNHGSKIFFSGLSDRETLDYASYLGGEEEVAQQSRTTDVSWGGNRRSVAESTARMKFLPADLMRQVPPGSALLLHGTLPAAHLVGRRPWEDRRLRNLAAGKLPEPEKVTRSERFLEALSVKSEVSEFVLAHMNQTLAVPDAPSAPDAKSDSKQVSESGLSQAPDPKESNGGSDTLDAPPLMAEQASAVERLNLLKAERDERPPMSIER